MHPFNDDYRSSDQSVNPLSLSPDVLETSIPPDGRAQRNIPKVAILVGAVVALLGMLGICGVAGLVVVYRTTRHAG